VLECVVNISEGRDAGVIADIAAAAGLDLLDVHSDPDHNRTVLTLLGEDAPRAVAARAVARLDLRRHDGVHPRLGVVDVVPFVPLEDSTPGDAVTARDAFARWATEELGVPCFAYGPLGPTADDTTWAGWPDGRTLPTVRREAFATLAPDTAPPSSPSSPHPTAGAMAVGARPVLVAYNVWLAEPDLAVAKAVAAAIRGPHLRTLGLPVGERVQVSMNLIDPWTVDPAMAFDAVAQHTAVAGAELVGLVPRSVLDRVDPARWAALDLGADRTIEARRAMRSPR